MERIRFVTHRGKQVLLNDLSGLSPEEVQELLRQVEEVITSQPHNSVLTLTDFSGTKFTREAADRMKVVATRDRPHVRRAALVGAQDMPDVFYRALVSFSAREFPVFRTREEALDWLVEEQEQAVAS